MTDTRDIQELDEVEIIKTGERAIVVSVDKNDKEMVHDSFILDIVDKNEMPNFYHQEEFRFIRR